MSVLIIDDDEFIYANLLKKRGIHITQKRDIRSLSEVEPFDIVICDVEGVGQMMNLSFGGALIAAMIKERYPEKKVIIHSASTHSNKYAEFFNAVDAVIPKGSLDLDDWITLLR